MIGIDTRLDRLLRAALTEDIGMRDLTSSLIPEDKIAKADAIFKEDGVLCGIPIAERIFRLIDQDLRFLPVAKDGEWIEKSRAIFYVEGKAKSILSAERTVLNFLAHMSAVATSARKMSGKIKSTKAKLFDTRKTTPLFRILDRYAVKTGGGENHRSGLYDGILFKENHLHILKPRSIKDLVHDAKMIASKKINVGVEVKTFEELNQALESDCDYILLDNFSSKDVQKAVELRDEIGSKIDLEVSGGIHADNILEYAVCGIERISSGSLTHSIKAIDISLNIL